MKVYLRVMTFINFHFISIVLSTFQREQRCDTLFAYFNLTCTTVLVVVDRVFLIQTCMVQAKYSYIALHPHFIVFFVGEHVYTEAFKGHPLLR